MSDQTSNSSTIDLYKFLHIQLNPDGTLSRLHQDPYTPPTPDPTLPISALSKDVTLNQSHHTSLRIFLPREALDHPSPNPNKLPLIVYFHGGGFIMCSTLSKLFHDFCVKIAHVSQSVVVSLEYRLAPEHRLPAAYDDAMEALHWIKTTQEEWLTHYADYSNCYLMGSSAGGTIAYHAGLRALAGANLEPLQIRGLILNQPFFSGTKRTELESRAVIDGTVPMCAIIDLMSELALPVGSDLDHEYFNQTAGKGREVWEKMKARGWRVMVTGCEGDPLVDRGKEMVRMMEEEGVEVVGHFEEGNHHAFEVLEPSKAMPLLEIVKSFVSTI